MIRGDPSLRQIDIGLTVSSAVRGRLVSLAAAKLKSIQLSLSLSPVVLLDENSFFLDDHFRGSEQWSATDIYARLFEDIVRLPNGAVGVGVKGLLTLDEATCDRQLPVTGARYALIQLHSTVIAVIVPISILELLDAMRQSANGASEAI